MEWTLLALGVVVLAGACALWQLMVQNGRILLRLETLETTGKQAAAADRKPTSLPVGAVLHDFDLPLLGGGSMTLSQWQGQRFLLIFVDPECIFSQSLASRMPAAPAVSTVIVSSGDAERNRSVFDERSHVLLQEGTEVADFFGILVTPSGYLVDEQGATAGELAVGADALLALMQHGVSGHGASPLRRIAGSGSKAGGLKAGTQAPDFTLPQFNGEELSLASFSGRALLLVFSDPACAPCLPLAAKLEQVHRASPRLRVLMISRGSAQANYDIVGKFDLTFPVVLQRHWEISRMYGTLATPVAYLIGGDGRLGSDVAVGESGILGLVSKIEKEQSLEQTI